MNKALVLVAIANGLVVAACNGGSDGGGSGGSSGGGGSSGSSGAQGGGVVPTLAPTNAPTSTPGATGTMTIGGGPMANATVAFTCGCTQEAGEVSADASGAYAITVPATLFGGGGQYTPPGHNLMVIGYGSGHAQTYSMEFLGNSPSHDLNLDGNASGNVANEFTTAAALYVYYETVQYYAAHPSNDNTYDIWNFNNIASFKQSLASSGGNNAAEKTLIKDVLAAQGAQASLYPEVPSWDKTSGDTVNAQIVSDLKAVASSGDPALPQICGTSCTATPTP